MLIDLKLQIQNDMKSAMRAKETERLGTIRLLLAAIKQKEIDERITVDDAEIIAILDKMIKQRKESIKQFEKANRQDLVNIEKAEISILQHYMPQPLSEEEMKIIIIEAISSENATSIKDMAKVITYIKNKAQGKVDTGKISTKIKSILSGQTKS